MSYDVVYTSASINQGPSTAHWGNNNLICFANSHSVGIYDPSFGSGGKVTFTLQSHSKNVTSARWLSGKEYETELISGSVDGKAIVWSLIGDDYIPTIIAKDAGNIILADGCYKNSDSEKCIFAISTTNNDFKIYERDYPQGNITLQQSIHFDKHVAMTLKFSHLPITNALVIGLGTDTGNFMLYAEDENGIFNKHCMIRAHKAWIRGLDFTTEGTDVLFATASQDTQIKLWRIKVYDDSVTNATTLCNDYICKNVKFSNNGVVFDIVLDAVLHGHDSWIYSVSFNQNLELLSTSIDKTMIIWHLPKESNLWVEKSRFGEMGNSSVGYMGGMFGPKGDIFAHGFFGTFHLWMFSSETKRWTPSVTVGGHTKEVVDLAWEPHGQFIYSMSHDQTTRIHAPWAVNQKIATWHEIARPQIHGYGMSCLALLSRYEYASGADEKVIRTFKAPRNFITNFKRICAIVENDKYNEDGLNMPQGASLPALGLSNKAVYECENNTQISSSTKGNGNTEFDTNFVPLILNEPPTEEDLLQNTLWPETHKLYAHVYELFALAATCDGTILASACKATSKEHACIMLWDTSTWVQLDKLESHNLTVTQLAFSSDSKHLLSVSRDRRWTLFSLDSVSGKYIISATTNISTPIHTRIIWCCAWLPNSRNFATGSRDGKVVIWKEKLYSDGDEPIDRYVPAGVFLFLKGQSVTALSVAPITIHDKFLVAVGLESGIIHLYLWSENIEEDQWKLFFTIFQRDAHHKSVKRLSFRNVTGRAGGDDDKDIIQLASCGADGVVRVFNIKLG